SHWLQRNPSMRWQGDMPDAELVDRFLHPCDRAYRVPDIEAWAHDAGMQVIDFVPRLLYDAGTWLPRGPVRDAVLALPRLTRYAFTELWLGALDKHSFFLEAAAHPAPPAATLQADDSDAGAWVPHFLPGPAAPLAKRLAEQPRLPLQLGPIQVQLPIPTSPLALHILAGVDSQRSFSDILQANSDSPPLLEAIAAFAPIYDALHNASLMALTRSRSTQGHV
ncbi:MAG: hypothetical protein ACPGUV_14030, partial [Polyangiales bacterium]